jgi:hypothetical protein
MKPESRSIYVLQTIGLILLIDAGLFLVTIVLCWLFKSLTLNSFSNISFIIGALTVIVSWFFGRDVIQRPRTFGPAGGVEAQKTVLSGSFSFQIIGAAAGFIVIAASILVPLILSK